MGKRGPPKTPTVLALLKGNPGKRALNRREPKATPLERLPAPPEWLGGYGRAMWRSLGPRLIDSKVLSHLDLSAFGMLCNAYQEFREADDAVRKHGLTFETTSVTGARKISARPEVAIRADSYRRTLRMMQEFGLTASSRTGVQVPNESPADPFADFMGRRGSRG